MGCAQSSTGTSDQRAGHSTTTVVIIQRENSESPVDKIVRQTGMNRSLAANLHRLFHDVVSNGRMGPTDFIATFLALHGQTPNNEHLVKFLARLYLVFDRQESGYLNFEEFATTIHLINEGDGAEKLGIVFRLCDTDKSGAIDRMEFVGTLRDIAAFIPGNVDLTGLALMAFANAAFSKMDLTGSGQVTPMAFIAALLANDDDDSLATIIGLVFSALRRVVTGDPPIPKRLRIIDLGGVLAITS